ncbi:hypothetical protein V1519DRAFT_403302, partial [Lipomyces tetrasporus]
MARHLQNHSIYPPDSIAEDSGTNKQPSIATFLKGKQNLTVQLELQTDLSVQGCGGCGYPPNFPISAYVSAFLKLADMYLPFYPPFNSMADIRQIRHPPLKIAKFIN